MSDMKTKNQSEPITLIEERLRSLDHRVILPVTAVATALFLNVTDGLFMERAITWRNEVFADTTAMRVGWVVLWGFIGFGIGWFVSGKHKALRSMLLGLVLGVIGFLLIFDHGAMGWGSSTFLSIVAFAVGLGFWLRNVVKELSKPSTTFGSAQWADAKELEEKKLVGQTGIRLGEFQSGDSHLPLQYNSDQHGVIAGASRTDKGTSFIVPNLLTYEGSMIVVDPKGENAMITAKRRKEMGQDVHVVDPWRIPGLPSSRFNPMDWLVPGDPDIGENSLLLADAIIMMESKNEPFFDNSSMAYKDSILLHLATDEAEAGQRTLGRARDLTMLDGDDLQKLFKRMLKSPLHKVRSAGAAMLQKEPKLLSNILASVQAQTSFLDSPRIRESLSVSDFDFKDLKTKPTTVCLVLPADRVDAYGRWLRLLIQQAITVMARDIETKPEKSVLFILDEMPSLGRLPMIETAFGLMAGYGMQLIAVCQNLGQLKSIYKENWETFISNAGVVQFHGSQDEFTCEYFSKLCGVATVPNLSTSIARGFSRTFGQNGSKSQSESTTDNFGVVQRRLIYADELRRMDETQQLTLVRECNPIIGRKKKWFKHPELKDFGVNLHEQAEKAKRDSRLERENQMPEAAE